MKPQPLINLFTQGLKVKLTMINLILLLSLTFSSSKSFQIRPSKSAFLPKQSQCQIDSSSKLLATTLKVSGGETSAPLSQRASIDDVVDAPLLNDIELLSGILATIVERESPKVHDKFLELRSYGLDRAAHPDGAMAPLEQMIECAKDLTPYEALEVMRTFSIALNLVNAAEVYHRQRLMRDEESEADESSSNVGPLPLLMDSVRGTIDYVLESGEAASTEDIMDKLCRQKVEIVLTAHPTEVNRRTLLRKYRQVAENLAKLDRPGLHPYEKSEAMLELRRIISSVWGADQIRRKKPTPQQEAAGGIAIIESTLWEAIPSYLRKLDAQCRVSLGKKLPQNAVPLKISSWMGGDRDGNPNVTPLVTKEVMLHQRLRAAKLYLKDLNALYDELAISSNFSNEFRVYANSIKDNKDKRELYRRVIGHLKKRFIRTVHMCEAELATLHTQSYLSAVAASSISVGSSTAHDETIDPIMKASELLEPLQIIYSSLVETGFNDVAEGLLLDLIRRVNCFGMTLVTLDIREESGKHAAAMDAITRYLGIGSYLEWNEETKCNFLQSELNSKRPFFRTRDMDKLGFDEGVLNTLKTYQMASTLDIETLGAYVISQAQTASDVLTVMVLQKQFGMSGSGAMRVAPLFETLDDLTNAPDVLRSLFSMPTYVGAVNGKQEVMVGYSDSAKDAGRLAANWALYESQEKMINIAKEQNIELTFFHGKGGTVGRGGNPALYRAILSHPPNTINSRFRVTEQGEMITQNFGTIETAERTFDIYTAAVLREAFVKHVEPKKEWREQMSRISKISCDDYRALVRHNAEFVPYFRQATPELELATMNIGSRPAKRNPKGGIESLRAIPWTFAWTQTRTHLSAWLGVGPALNDEHENSESNMREMYAEWPWFRETVDLIAMILSKTDFSISKNYDDQLVQKTSTNIAELGNTIRDMLVSTREGVTKVTGTTDTEGPHSQLQRLSNIIRNPYVDPINVVQAELLKRLRSINADDSKLSKSELEEKRIIQDALITSINGIVQGMRNSG